MFNRLRRTWQEFRNAPPGSRFRQRYTRRTEERAQGESQWSRPLLLAAAVVNILIAIPLMVLPGPAILFYLIAGFLIAGESIWVARIMDRLELSVRRILRRWRRPKSGR